MLLSAFDVHDGHRLYPDLRVIMEVCLSWSRGDDSPQLFYCSSKCFGN